MFRSPWTPVTIMRPLEQLLGSGDPDELVACPGRVLTVNGERLAGAAFARFAAVEESLGFRLMTGRYWYDPASGAFGRCGQPTAGFLPARLALGGPMDPHCSGGGTDIHVNGRELHDVDRRSLERRVGRMRPGRYALSATGLLRTDRGDRCWDLRRHGRIEAA